MLIIGIKLSCKIFAVMKCPKSHERRYEEMRKLFFFSESAMLMTVSLFCLVLYSGSPAYADESLLCADEIEKFCKDVKPGGGRIIECLKAHEAELCAACRGKIGELQGFIKDCEHACSGDIAQFCKEIQPGGGRIIKCLREHEKQLSPSCSAKLEMIGKRFQKRGEEK
jgi:hypothetical protein